MYPFLRLSGVVATSLLRPGLSFADESVIPFRVLPSDLDNNLHMNNGRYLMMMDLARWDMLLRARLVGAMLRRRWMPVVSRIEMRFRRSLGPFQRYELRSRVDRWDAKWFFIQQRFERGGVLHAEGEVQGLLRSPQGNVPPEALMALDAKRRRVR